MRPAIVFLFAPLWLAVSAAFGQDAGYSVKATAEDRKRILAGVQAMHDAMVKGDADAILAGTYPRLIQFSGGEKIFKETIEQAFRQLKADGMKFESYQLGEPSKLHLAGSDWLCFVPETSVARIQGRRVRSTGFVIGVKSGSSTKWRFLEGVHLKNDPEALWRLFPDLSRNIKLAPIKQEVIEDKPGIPK